MESEVSPRHFQPEGLVITTQEERRGLRWPGPYVIFPAPLTNVTPNDASPTATCTVVRLPII